MLFQSIVLKWKHFATTTRLLTMDTIKLMDIIVREKLIVSASNKLLHARSILPFSNNTVSGTSTSSTTTTSSSSAGSITNHNVITTSSSAPVKTIRDILLEQGRVATTTTTTTATTPTSNSRTNSTNEANRVAVQLLSIDKEINLMRYYGMWEYVKTKGISYFSSRTKKGLTGYVQRLFTSTSSSSSSNKPTDNNDATSSVIDSTNGTSSDTTTTETNATSPVVPKTNPTVGKVAFMITASMRNVLVNELQYNVDEIKTMTPIEASLIIQNSIPPSERITRLPIVLQEYHDNEKRIQEEQLQLLVLQQRKQQQEEVERRQRNEQEQQKQQDEIVARQQTLVNSIGTTSSIPPSGNTIVTSTSLTTTKRRLWYELVEVIPVSTSVTANATPATTSDSIATNLSTGTEDETITETTETTTANTDTSTSTPTPGPETASVTENIIGLYTSKEEAELGLETHQYFADRKEQEQLKIRNKSNATSSTPLSVDAANPPPNSNTPIFIIRESWR